MTRYYTVTVTTTKITKATYTIPVSHCNGLPGDAVDLAVEAAEHEGETWTKPILTSSEVVEVSTELDSIRDDADESCETEIWERVLV